MEVDGAANAPHAYNEQRYDGLMVLRPTMEFYRRFGQAAQGREPNPTSENAWPVRLARETRSKLPASAPGIDVQPEELSSNPEIRKLQIVRIIAEEGKKLGLRRHVIVAGIAAAIRESSLDPFGDGDGGASIGIFQLNFAGGEGSELQQAYRLSERDARRLALNPRINARWALRYFVPFQKEPDHGKMAKRAQRPGDVNYVAHVNRYVREAEGLLARVMPESGT
jgi:hypothetical protein